MKNLRFTTKLLMGAAVAVALSVSTTSCSDDDDDDDSTPSTTTPSTSSNVVRVTSNITSNTTWSSDKEYHLAGRIQVTDGATLTITEGTVIKGEAGTGTNATALIIAQGGMINAVGTASQPIIFTTVADRITATDIDNGDFASPNLSPDQNGFWGGVIVLGKAPFIGKSSPTEGIEGVASSENAIFGGTEPGDNSGTMRYISIRHGGSNIGAGNEINGLTLGGVGNGTTIEHIEIVGNADDGIEFFGGTVNVSNLVVWNSFDDAVDTDYEWTGTLDNFVVVTPRDHCMELDGPEDNSQSALTNYFTLKNGTIVANSSESDASDLMNIDGNTNGKLENVHFTSVKVDQEIETDNANFTFTGVTVDVPMGGTLVGHTGGAAVNGITASTTGAATGKADVSVLSWTWAAKAGGLTGL